MRTTCSECGSPIEANREKLGVLLAGMGVVSALGVLAAMPTTWVAVIPAALAGSGKAAGILRAKLLAMKASRDAGGYFRCRGCKRDIPIGEILS